MWERSELRRMASRLVVSLDVFADCADLACTRNRLDEKSKSKAAGAVYDRIFIRHWDSWSDGRISQLFVLTLENGIVKGDPLPLSAALDADVPSRPFGDASEYTFSPDGSKLVFCGPAQRQVRTVVDQLRSVRSRCSKAVNRAI